MTESLGDRILEELLYRGPLDVDTLSKTLRRSPAEVRSALAGLHRGDKEPQLIEYRADKKIGRVSHG